MTQPPTEWMQQRDTYLLELILLVLLALYNSNKSNPESCGSDLGECRNWIAHIDSIRLVYPKLRPPEWGARRVQLTGHDARENKHDQKFLFTQIRSKHIHRRKQKSMSFKPSQEIYPSRKIPRNLVWPTAKHFQSKSINSNNGNIETYQRQ